MQRANRELLRGGVRRRTFGDAGTVPAGLLGGGSGGSFAGARVNRLTADFLAQSQSADQALYGSNLRLRARARDLGQNNGHARKFLQMVKQNVVGAHGILMKSKVTSANDKDTAATERINKRIEDEWKRWCRVGRCTADGRFSFTELQLMAIANIAREGENLVKFVYGRQFNDSAIALQPLDNDQLDDSMMQTNGAGGEIRMGVEVDQYRRPLGYWLYNSHPNDMLPGGRERKRVPAEDIVHSAVFDRPGQTRGITWMVAAIPELHQFGGWKEATMVAARASAAKFATIEKDFPTEFVGDYDRDPDDEEQQEQELMSAEAGEILKLDQGEHLNFTDPRFPTNTYEDFARATLRDVATALLVSYPSLGNDLNGVNFSSIRAGLLDERDMWRVVQRWFIEHFCEPIRQKWLSMALLTTLKDITLTPDQMEQVEWRARGWDWVDPQKDAQATILKLGEGLTTMEIECAKMGHDWQEIAKQRKKEADYFAEIGVVFGVDITGDQGGKGVAAGDEKEAAETTGGKQQGSKGAKQ